MINSFKNYLIEEEKTLYFVWGRMNPPTAGHEKLLDFLKVKAAKNPYRIYLTQTVDKNKNPIPFAQKIKFARKGFPQYARQIIMNKKIRTIFEALTSFYNEGFKRIVIVAGEDRIRQYDVLLKKYNGAKGKHGFYNFERIDVLNAGKRDPESEGVEGVSGTKLRDFVKAGDFAKFSQYMPKKLSTVDAKQVFNSVRKGLGLKEQKEFVNHVQLEKVSDKREEYVNGNLFQPGDKVVVKDTDVVAEVKHLGPNYVVVESNGVQMRKWIEHVEFLERNTSPKPAALNNKMKEMKDEGITRFKKMYSETAAIKRAKERINREKEADELKHTRLKNRARLKDVRDGIRKNRETA